MSNIAPEPEGYPNITPRARGDIRGSGAILDISPSPRARANISTDLREQRDTHTIVIQYRANFKFLFFILYFYFIFFEFFENLFYFLFLLCFLLFLNVYFQKIFVYVP